MMLNTRLFAGFVLVASAVVLGAALVSQYWGGLVPCELCLLERWPWTAAITISLVALFAGSRPGLPWVAAALGLVFAVGAVIAFYHVGVEQRWFAGPTACTAPGGAATTVEELKRQLLATPTVRCDEVQWSLFGVSLAGWDLVASLIMFAICAATAAAWRAAADPGIRRGTA
jgi:disulfide bond formation protein DsbB